MNILNLSEYLEIKTKQEIRNINFSDFQNHHLIARYNAKFDAKFAKYALDRAIKGCF